MITIWRTPIVATVEQVFKDIKLQLYGTGLLKEMNNTGSDLMVTCPFHGNGREHNPSCGVLLKDKVLRGKKYEAGTVHCFTCGYTADLPQFIADVMGMDSSVDGYKWLVGKYNYSSSQEREPLELNLYRGREQKASYMDEDEVERFYRELLNSHEACEYLEKRKLSREVMDAYRLGYDKADKTVLFPVRDMEGRVVFYKGRSIAGKHFYNAKDIDKSSLVFGLYELCELLKRGVITSATEIWITESEIDALSLRAQGEYAVAIMGSHISDEQCKELERAPFRRFILATDNDDAGRKGASQIKRLLIPKGFRFTNLRWETELKDINDLVKQFGGNWRDYLTGY